MFYLNQFKAVVLRGKWVLFTHDLNIKETTGQIDNTAFGQPIFSYYSKLGLNAYSSKAASGLLAILGS